MTDLRIPRWFVREAIKKFRLTPSESVTYIGLLDHVGKGADGYRVVRPSQRTLAEKLGLNRRTVQSAIHRLVAVGLIEEREAGRPGRAARYFIPDDMPLVPSTLPAPTRRAVWDDSLNAWVENDQLVHLDRHAAARHAEESGASGLPSRVTDGPNATRVITRQSVSTGASGPPEVTKTRERDGSRILSMPETVIASVLAAPDGDAEPDHTNSRAALAERATALNGVHPPAFTQTATPGVDPLIDDREDEGAASLDIDRDKEAT